jgi:predicted ATPase
MIRALFISNFKPFDDRLHQIPLAPLTLIYGPNSAGKSSILQALLLMKQSLEMEGAFPPLLRMNGPFVRLVPVRKCGSGGKGDVLWNHDLLT